MNADKKGFRVLFGKSDGAMMKDALGFAAVFAMLAVLSAGGKKYAERLEV